MTTGSAREKSTHVAVRLLVSGASLALLIGASAEMYQIGWGTGVWLGQFAPTWFGLFLLFVLVSVAAFFIVARILWHPETFGTVFGKLAATRDRLGVVRWFIAAVLLFLPVLVLQYTFWGLVLHGPYLRMLFVILLSIAMGWLLTSDNSRLLDWNSLLVSLLLMTVVLAIFAPLGRVTSYPFSLGWSEGNRLWDYSVLFGRERYLYPADQPIPVFLERNRQLVGAIPFLLPGVRIEHVRLWLALVDIIPYLLLGWVAFYLPGKKIVPWVLAGLWAFTFVRQGPIHPPLLICATIVALAWRRPLWLAVPLIFAAGYFAESTRYTWLFAPAMWSVMLEFASASELNKNVWRRSIWVGVAGVLGGYVAPFLLPKLLRFIEGLGQPASTGIDTKGGVTLSTIEQGLTGQPLIWSRLFPNETYGPGILIGLILAVVPLILVLVHLVRTGRWQLNGLQKTSVVLPLLAFLAVGLIVSTKIGGGGDLHNLDMFIIGLMFAAAIAWQNGGHEWIRNTPSMPAWVPGMLIAMLVLPAWRPLMEMRPLSITKDIRVVATLADITPIDPLPDPLPDTLPSEEETERALSKIQQAVQMAVSTGDVLFMDQRQLLTFGFVRDVPLVPDYDKKLLIDNAMSEDADYFNAFYDDLASQRFSLIISSPLNRRLDQEEGHFAEENNAWVKWVTKPLLCYYEPVDLLKKVDVQLLVPRKGVLDCASELPSSAP